MDAAFIDAVADARPAQTTGDGLKLTTEGFRNFLRDLSQLGKIAYIETDYFGGVGGQGAAVCFNGDEIMVPTWRSRRTINDALRIIGVRRTLFADQFSAIGLREFRSNDALLDAVIASGPNMHIPRPVPGWKPSTPAATGSQIDELTRHHPAVAVHFWAVWNGIDALMDKSVQAVTEQFAGRVHFVSCDIDLPENSDLCCRCGFVNIPAISVFRGGHVERPIVGYRSPEQLVIEIEKRLEECKHGKRWWAFWK